MRTVSVWSHSLEVRMVKNLVCMAPWMGKRPLSPHHVSFLVLFLKQKGSNYTHCKTSRNRAIPKSII